MSKSSDWPCFFDIEKIGQFDQACLRRHLVYHAQDMLLAALLALVAALNIGESHLPHEVARRWGRVFAKSGYKVVFSGFQVEAGIQ